jgi:uncharacterized protein YdaU (DUF1376 family)
VRAGCTGKRNRAEFVALAEFDDAALMSDYRFLEDAAAASEAAARNQQRTGEDIPQVRQLQHQASPAQCKTRCRSR